MKPIINITRTELRTFFYSPIAWLVLIIFSFQCGLSLTDNLSAAITDSHAGFRMFDLTGRLLAYFNGYFSSVHKTVFLYLPLLTMGLISRELSSGSIKLIFSSPINTTELVLGKYLAMLIYCLLMSLIAALAIIPAALSIGHFDYGLAFSGLFSTFLLISTYAAIGLFMSCLTAYQVAAAISTMVLLGALTYVGEIGKGTDTVRDITGFLSIAGRAENLRDGLMISTDMTYFALVIVFFLLLSMYYLSAKQKVTTLTFKTIRLTSVLAVFSLVCYTASKPALTYYFDFTATKQRTIANDVQQALQAIDGPMKVTTYVNLLDESYWEYVSPDHRKKDRDFWLPYVRFKPEIKFEYVYYYGKIDNPYLYQANPRSTDRQLAAKIADAYNLNMDKILPVEKLADKNILATQGNTTVRILEANGHKVPLRLFEGELDANPNQQDINDALRLLKEKPVRIAFLTGEAERRFDQPGDLDYKTTLAQLRKRHALVNHGFEFMTTTALTPVDSSVDVLVIADPRVEISPVKQYNIADYVDKGRNLLILGDPGSSSVLNPIVQQLGLRFKPGIIVQSHDGLAPTLAKMQIQPTAKILDYPKFESNIGGFITSTGITAIEANDKAGFSLFPILGNDPENNWMRSSGMLPDTGKVIFQSKLGDQRGKVLTAYGLKRQKDDHREQRILVFGDADWLTAPEVYRPYQQVGPHHNFQMTDAIFKWLSNGRFPRDIYQTPPPDSVIKGDKGSVFRFRIFFLGLLPGLLLATGAILLIRRRGK